MQKYLQNNLTYWQKGYEAENVESFVFRPYGRIFRWEFGFDGSRHEKVLDFGCGAGAALRFFKSKGFDVYGVDMSEIDIETARKRMPDIAAHLSIIDPLPNGDLVYFPDLGRQSFDIVIAIQSLFYFSNHQSERGSPVLYGVFRLGFRAVGGRNGPTQLVDLRCHGPVCVHLTGTAYLAEGGSIPG